MRVRDELTVAMSDPQDLAAIDALARTSGCRIRPVFTLATGIDRLLPRCYEDDFHVDSDTAGMDVEQLELESEAIDLDSSGIEQLAEGSPVINLVNYAIIQAGSTRCQRYSHRSRAQEHIGPISHRWLAARGHETAS